LSECGTGIDDESSGTERMRVIRGLGIERKVEKCKIKE